MNLHSKWVVLGNVSVGTFMATLDGGIVNVSLPVMARSLNTNILLLQWVITSYLLTISSFLLIFGRLADLFGKKTIYSLGFLVFTLGSLLCAFSSNVYYLIASRIIQAIGASMLMANGLALITSTFPEKDRGKALGLIGSVVAIGSLTGPVVGGLLISWFGWPSVFLVNLPFGLMGFLIAYFVLKKETMEGPKENFDFMGAVLFALGMAVFLFTLTQAEHLGWHSPSLYLYFALAVGLLSTFVLYELKVNNPMLDFSLFNSKTFLYGNLAGGISFISIFSVTILLPFYLDQILMYSPSKIGLMLAPFPLAMAIISPISGSLADKLSIGLLTSLGLGIKTLGLFSMLFLDETTSSLEIMGRMFFLGIGSGLFQSPNNISVMGAVPHHKLGLAGGINSLVRNIGMIMGIAFSVSLFSSSLKSMSFLEALDSVFIWASAISFVGVVISSLRPETKKASNKD